MGNFNYKKVLVLGLSKSGKAAIRLLKTLEVEIYVADEIISEGEISKIFSDLKYVIYDELTNRIKEFDLIIKSPGIKYDIDILKKARSKKVPVISEVEFAYQFVDKKKVIIGVTGTNGKTTTTTLITQILNDCNIRAVSVGNIGYSLSDAIVDKCNVDVYVTELSSFQLLDTNQFKPHIAVILNIAEAHIDYHNSFKNYINAKFKMIKNLKVQDYLVFNADDPIIIDKVKKNKASKLPFSLKTNEKYAYYQDDVIYYRNKSMFNKSDMHLLGLHNIYNVVAAINVVKIFDIDDELIIKSIKNFKGLPHRIQLIDTINGVTYYNDSKSSNIESTICALNAMKEPVYLLIGGKDRGADFTEIVTHQKTKMIITYGETRDKIVLAAIKNKKNCIVCETLSDGFSLTQKNN